MILFQHSFYTGLSNIFHLNQNYFIIYKNKNFVFEDVPGDGLCFFHSLHKDPFFSSRYTCGYQIRLAMVKEVRFHYSRNPFLQSLFMSFQKNIQNWIYAFTNTTVATWAGLFEHLLVTLVFKVNIITLFKNNNGDRVISDQSQDNLQRYFLRWNITSPIRQVNTPHTTHTTYILHHTYGDIMKTQCLIYNHYGYLRPVSSLPNNGIIPPADDTNYQSEHKKISLTNAKSDKNKCIGVSSVPCLNIISQDTICTQITHTSHNEYKRQKGTSKVQKHRQKMGSTIIGKEVIKKRNQSYKNKRAYTALSTTIYDTSNKKQRNKTLHNQKHQICDTIFEENNMDSPFQNPDTKKSIGKIYSKDKVYLYWKQCIQYGIDFNDPHKALNSNDYKNQMEYLRSKIKNAKNRAKKDTKTRVPTLSGLGSLPFSKQKIFANLIEFERQTMNIHHLKCANCKRVTLYHHDSKSSSWRKKQGKKNEYHCNLCDTDETFKEDLDTILPIWYNDLGVKQYYIPGELEGLTVAEQLLIQRISGYVPLIHIKNGNFGIKGSCCAFRQDIKEVCTKLPRQRVELVKYIRDFTRESNLPVNAKVLSVRRTKVLKALYWLKKYHVDYKNDEELVIDENNLSWMEGKEKAQIANCEQILEEAPSTKTENTIKTVQTEENTSVRTQCSSRCDKNNECTNEEDIDVENDEDEDEDEKHCSISQLQRIHIGDKNNNDNEEIEYYGSLGDNDSNVNNPNAREQIEKLQKTYSKQVPEERQDHTLPWPSVSKEPENEFTGIRIFVNMFPWLFPGGIGDINETQRSEKKLHFKTWSNYLLHYFDGRFAKDKIWCFYTENMRQRRENMSSGSFFINNFVKSNIPESVEELQEMIDKGDCSFIDKLQYYAQKSQGSDAYWRKQRHEVESWINYHVENGNGPPTLFLTLSCAEYYWPDIIRLLQERILLASKDEITPDLRNDPKALRKAVIDYSIVIQEYFHKRVQLWIKTVGRKIFQIKHFWYRHEFAKGRGQIHTHMLCILKNNKVMKNAYQLADDKQKKVQVLADYMRSTFDLTATHPATKENGEIDIEKVGHPEGTNPTLPYSQQPTLKYLWEILDHDKDICDLVNSCQMHECNKFCLRPKGTGKNKKIYCRCGCGEVDSKTDQTPGYDLQETDTIVVDSKQIKRLALQRNSTRMNQTSLTALRSWRANCDFQLILYDSDPDHPNLDEIGHVSDYVVSYACKGNMSKISEKGLMKNIIEE